MAKLKHNHQGQRFGRLVAQNFVPRTTMRGGSSWECLCDCGARKIVYGSDLRNGNTVSCGCKKSEQKDIMQLIFESIAIKENGCWEWVKYRNKTGYGIFGRSMGRRNSNVTNLAHRAAYRIFVEPIPPGLFVCHSCDNPPCVNPAHLWLGTHQDNMTDMVKKGRSKKGRKIVAAAITKEKTT